MKCRRRSRSKLIDAFHIAVETGQKPIVLHFLFHGVDIHSPYGEMKDYALWIAVDMGDLEMVKLLTRHGANIHVNDDEPLLSAAEQGYTEIVEFLTRNGASAKYVSDEIYDLTMKNATEKGYTEITDILKRTVRSNNVNLV